VDLDFDNNGQEIESEGNDDDSDDNGSVVKAGGVQIRGQMNHRHNRPQTIMLMAETQMRLTVMVSRMRTQLEVRIVEIVPQSLVTKVFAAFKHQRIMIMFVVVMMEVMAMCAMEMMMNAMAMCRTKMMGRLPTTLVLVKKSRVLSWDKTTTSLESPKRRIR
jgi:hypothetical protein